jgi:hypothetical protein
MLLEYVASHFLYSPNLVSLSLANFIMLWILILEPTLYAPSLHYLSNEFYLPLVMD